MVVLLIKMQYADISSGAPVPPLRHLERPETRGAGAMGRYSKRRAGPAPRAAGPHGDRPAMSEGVVHARRVGGGDADDDLRDRAAETLTQAEGGQGAERAACASQAGAAELPRPARAGAAGAAAKQSTAAEPHSHARRPRRSRGILRALQARETNGAPLAPGERRAFFSNGVRLSYGLDDLVTRWVGTQCRFPTQPGRVRFWLRRVGPPWQRPSSDAVGHHGIFWRWSHAHRICIARRVGAGDG